MKTIKVFLASSEELQDDRYAFGNLIRRLDRMYEKRGIRIELFEWEDYDAAYNARRKQDEYNDAIRSSDMFLALFHTKAGKFTIEEFDVATEEFRRHASPKVYTYCKDLLPGEQESPELTDFKRKLFEEMGHYWSRYSNRDTMQLHFVMQLQLIESSPDEQLDVNNGVVRFGGVSVANMDNLSFAFNNEEYQRMQEELLSLPERIDKARKRLERFPDDEDLQDDLLQLQNRYDRLNDDFQKKQKDLCNTAAIVCKIQSDRVNALTRRAIDAFNEGQIERAKALLDEVAIEAEKHIEQLERDRSIVHQDVRALLFQAKLIQNDGSIQHDDRVTRVKEIYAKAYDWAIKSALAEKDLESLLTDYGNFLIESSMLEDAAQICTIQTSLSEKLYGDSIKTSLSYGALGNVYEKLHDYPKAFEFFIKEISCLQKRQSDDFLPSKYYAAGIVAYKMGKFDKALDLLSKGLEILELNQGKNSQGADTFYDKIGHIYAKLGNNEKALAFYENALTAREEIYVHGNECFARSYNNIGVTFLESGNYEKAQDYFEHALSELDSLKTMVNRRIVLSYGNTFGNLGLVYKAQDDGLVALDYMRKAERFFERILGPNHPKTKDVRSQISCIEKDVKGSKDEQ